MNIAKTVRVLNAHHRSTLAGFYGTAIGGRFFKARQVDGQLQVSDWDRWVTVPPEKAIFHDHNGNNIPL